jgi:outer membrane receptor protein involved in Fe transport
LNVVARNDVSSTLPEENRSYFYPSVSTSFIFTEALNLTSNWLDYGKLRVGYAQVGNEANPYRLITTYNVLNAYGSQNRLSLSDRLNNLELQNELTKEIEIGTDLKFLNGRIGAEITWFKKNSFDQIVSASTAPSSGFSSQVINAGEIQNSGWEIGLNLVPVSLSNGFEWSIFTSFTKILSEVIAVNDDIVISGDGSNSGNPVINIHRQGEQYGQIFGTRIARHTDGSMLIDPALGTPINDDGAHIVGNPNPDFILGINNQFSWKVSD